MGQESVSSLPFLILTGFAIFGGNAVTTASLYARAQAASEGIKAEHAATVVSKLQRLSLEGNRERSASKDEEGERSPPISPPRDLVSPQGPEPWSTTCPLCSAACPP